MSEGKDETERRKHKRYRAHDGAFAVLGPHSTKIGQIIDVSVGGLAFSYIAGKEPSDATFELSILFAQDSFHLTKIPFKTISDQEAKEVPSNTLTMRRSGLQFGELTPSQISQLQYFIRNCTTGEV
ncbi:MAG: PilZ domain-containing protein [Desulfobacterales bacterium]|nr:MAG: PilZ domain-containing protein [Desulfobacterales bacterium]